MGDGARQLWAEAKVCWCMLSPALHYLRRGNGIEGSVALYTGHAIAVQTQKIVSATAGWIKISEPFFVGPYGAANAKICQFIDPNCLFFVMRLGLREDRAGLCYQEHIGRRNHRHDGH